MLFKRMARTSALLFVLGTLVLAAACGPDAAPTPGGTGVIDVGLQRAVIGKILADWEGALEAYDVDGMLDPIAPGVIVTIRENGAAQPAKDYATLRDELEANAPNQIRMRVEDGYVIDINFDLVISVDSGGSGRAVGTFAATETITDVAGTLIYESGTIDANLVMTGGDWLITALDLNFNVAP